MPPALTFAIKSSPKLSIDHNLNWLLAANELLDPHPPAPQVPAPQPVPDTNTSKPTLI